MKNCLTQLEIFKGFLTVKLKLQNKQLLRKIKDFTTTTALQASRFRSGRLTGA